MTVGLAVRSSDKHRTVPIFTGHVRRFFGKTIDSNGEDFLTLTVLVPFKLG